MMVPRPPTSAALPLLLPLLVPIARTGRDWARALGFTNPSDTRAAGPVLGAAALLLSVHFSCLASQNFGWSLVVGFSLVALPGIWSFAREPLSARDWNPAATARDWLPLLTTLVFIAPTALGWAFHDELYITGHWSVAAAIQNGIYPPVNMNLPDLPLQYHYGFALLTAILSTVANLPLPVAVDVLTLASWCATWLLLSALASRALPSGNRAPPWLLPIAVLFGAGLPYFCGQGIARWLGICYVDGLLVNPPVISYFFQHPWNLGLPFGLLLLLAHFQDDTKARPFALALLLTALSLSQIAFFAAIFATLLACESLRSFRIRAFVPFVAALAAARLAGGFFAGIAEDEASAHLFNFKLGVVPGPSDLVFWHLTAFGIGLPLGLWGLRRLDSRARPPVALLILGGLGVLNTLDHARDDAANKFATVASLGLGFGVAALVAHHWRTHPWRARLALAVHVSAGVLFPAIFALGLTDIPVSVYHREATALGASDIEVTEWLRPRIARGDLVYRAPAKAWGYAHWAGLPQVWLEDSARRFGFAAERIARRERLFPLQPPAEFTLPSDPAPYASERVRWWIVDSSDPRDAPYRALLDGWSKTGSSPVARVVKVSGTLTVYEFSLQWAR